MDDQADMLAVSQLISFERHWRDKGQWEKMRSAYHPDSVVRVAWFQGTGFEFVEASTRALGERSTRHFPAMTGRNWSLLYTRRQKAG